MATVQETLVVEEQKITAQLKERQLRFKGQSEMGNSHQSRTASKYADGTSKKTEATDSPEHEKENEQRLAAMNDSRKLESNNSESQGRVLQNRNPSNAVGEVSGDKTQQSHHASVTNPAINASRDLTGPPTNPAHETVDSGSTRSHQVQVAAMSTPETNSAREQAQSFSHSSAGTNCPPERSVPGIRHTASGPAESSEAYLGSQLTRSARPIQAVRPVVNQSAAPKIASHPIIPVNDQIANTSLQQQGKITIPQNIDELHLNLVLPESSDSDVKVTLSRMLDREHTVINNWRHLAYYYRVPSEVLAKFEGNQDVSPTEQLFELLQNWYPDMTIGQLKQKLKLVYRNDVIMKLGKYPDGFKVADLTESSHLIEMLKDKLDSESKVVGNWKSLAIKFQIPKRKIDKLGVPDQSPTAALFTHARASTKLAGLTLQRLKKIFNDLDRHDAVRVLEKYGYEESNLVSIVLVPHSDILEDLCECLDKDMRVLKGWRHVAFKLGISNIAYETFDQSKKAKSPTKGLLTWLMKSKPGITVGEMLVALRKIERQDAFEELQHGAEKVLQMIKADSITQRENEASSKLRDTELTQGRTVPAHQPVDLSQHPAPREIRTSAHLQAQGGNSTSARLPATREIGTSVHFQAQGGNSTSARLPATREIGTSIHLQAQGGNSTSACLPAPRENGNSVPNMNPQRYSLTQEDKLKTRVVNLPLYVKKTICTMLNPTRAFFEDYRMLGDALGLGHDQIKALEGHQNPTYELLTSYSQGVTVQNLLRILQDDDFNRQDVVEKINEWVNC